MSNFFSVFFFFKYKKRELLYQLTCPILRSAQSPRLQYFKNNNFLVAHSKYVLISINASIIPFILASYEMSHAALYLRMK